MQVDIDGQYLQEYVSYPEPPCLYVDQSYSQTKERIVN